MVLFISPAHAIAAAATGYIRAQCPLTGDSRFHLIRVDSHNLGHELLLRIPEQGAWETLGIKWYDYPGEVRSSGECEPATSSKVQIVRVVWTSSVPFRSKRIQTVLGNFDIRLRDGRTFSGPFNAKFRNLPKGSVCE